MALLSGLIRVAAASSVSGGVAWLTLDQSHPCDSDVSTFGWALIFVPTVFGLLFSLRPYSPLVLVMGGMLASMVVVYVGITETLGDGSISPNGSQCEPGAAGFVLLVPITFVLLTVLLLVLHGLGFERQRRAR
ncbi:MAG: hypothetical protein AB7P33_13845 [Dehalococcoidia bacterium]